MSNEWRDGRLVQAPATPEKLGVGWGAFTTVGCDRGRPLLWSWHHERLRGSLMRLGAGENLRLPDEHALRGLLEAEGLNGPARVRIVGRAGIDSLWCVVATAAACTEVGPDQAPARLAIDRWPGVPSLTGHKTLNRGRWDVARERAQELGADDALLVDAEGHVLETAVANIWVRHKGVLLTPPAPSRCLPGVMRRWLLERGGDLGVRVRECDLGIDDVAAADEVFVSNSVRGFRRVYRVVDRRWTQWPFFERLAAGGVPAPGWVHHPIR